MGLLAVPAASLGGASATKDGTLSIKDGDGMVFIWGTGAIIGRVDKAERIFLLDVQEEDGSGLTITGCDFGSGKEKSTEDGEGSYAVCRGAKIKFKLIGGKFRIRISGAKGIDMSVVGRTDGKDPEKGERVTLDGDGNEDEFDGNDGTYAFNDDDPQSMPDKLKKFQLGS